MAKFLTGKEVTKAMNEDLMRRSDALKKYRIHPEIGRAHV